MHFHRNASTNYSCICTESGWFQLALSYQSLHLGQNALHIKTKHGIHSTPLSSQEQEEGEMWAIERADEERIRDDDRRP